MARRLLFPLGLGFALAAAGLILLNGSILAVSIPFFLFASVRLLAAARCGEALPRIERTVPRLRLVEGDEVEVELSLHGSGALAPLLCVADDPPPGFPLIAGGPQFLGRLPRRERTCILYTVSARRGLHRFGDVRVSIWSPWSLAMREERVALETELKVHPHIEKLDPIVIRPRQTRAFAGAVKANQGGQGLDFYGCRAYTPGDDVRRINWRAFAKQGSLVINEYELERIADVNVILDARAKVHTQLGGETTFDHAVRAAASLAAHFLDQGNNVGLLVYGDYVHWAFPGTGRLQKERILDHLAAARLGDKAVFEELRFLPTRLFPARSQLVLVSPLGDVGDIEIVATLIDRGYSVLLVCPHSLASRTSRRDPASAIDLARRLLTLKRTLFLASLAAVGTSVIDWPVDEPLRAACQRIHHARVRRYRV